jgi:hypothetical protein
MMSPESLSCLTALIFSTNNNIVIPPRLILAFLCVSTLLFVVSIPLLSVYDMSWGNIETVSKVAGIPIIRGFEGGPSKDD